MDLPRERFTRFSPYVKSHWLLKKVELVIFRSVAPGRMHKLQWMALHPCTCGEH